MRVLDTWIRVSRLDSSASEIQELYSPKSLFGVFWQIVELVVGTHFGASEPFLF